MCTQPLFVRVRVYRVSHACEFVPYLRVRAARFRKRHTRMRHAATAFHAFALHSLNTLHLKRHDTTSPNSKTWHDSTLRDNRWHLIIWTPHPLSHYALNCIKHIRWHSMTPDDAMSHMTQRCITLHILPTVTQHRPTWHDKTTNRTTLRYTSCYTAKIWNNVSLYITKHYTTLHRIT